MMGTMTNGDVVVLAIAGYVAVMALARLMLRRRDHLMTEFRTQFQREKHKKALLQKQAEQLQRRSAA